MTILPNIICRFNAICIKIPMLFFTELEQKDIIHMETQKTWIAKAILRKKNRARGINLPDFRMTTKLYYQDSMVLAEKQKYRPMEQDRKPRNKPTYLWIANVWKEARIYNGAKRVSSISAAGKTWQLHGKKMKLDYFLTPYTKINSHTYG